MEKGAYDTKPVVETLQVVTRILRTTEFNMVGDELDFSVYVFTLVCKKELTMATRVIPMVIEIKCSDQCVITYPNGVQRDGYAPENHGIGDGGDYVRIEIDVESGQIIGWNDQIKQEIQRQSKLLVE